MLVQTSIDTKNVNLEKNRN